MTLYERFADTKEEGFREQFIKPLLVRLGFVGISNQHGSQEFGKNYVFSEIDPFGQQRHYAIQAKHLETIGQGREVDGLVNQIEQCFYVEYTVPFAPTERRRVSSVYVFNSGEITANAEKLMRSELKKEFEANVRFFGGHHLEIIANSAALRRSEELRPRLIALRNELNQNMNLWRSIVNEEAEPDLIKLAMEVNAPLSHAIESFLAIPHSLNLIDYGDILFIWRQMTGLTNTSLKPHMDFLNTDYDGVKTMAARLIEKTEDVLARTELALTELAAAW